MYCRNKVLSDVVVGETPFHHSLLAGADIHHVSARRRMMPRYCVFPIRLARLDGFKKVADMQNRVVRTLFAIALAALEHASLARGRHLARPDFRILIVRLLQTARPSLDDPAIVFVRVLRRDREAAS